MSASHQVHDTEADPDQQLFVFIAVSDRDDLVYKFVQACNDGSHLRMHAATTGEVELQCAASATRSSKYTPAFRLTGTFFTSAEGAR